MMLIGTDGSGKTVTMHYLAEKYHEAKVDVSYLAPAKLLRRKVTPKWMKLQNWKYAKFLPDTMHLLDDAQLRLHAREHSQRKNIIYDKILTVARHRKAGVIVTTQETHRIDRNMISRLHFLMSKKPSLFAQYIERPFMRGIIEAIKRAYKEANFKNPQEYTYVIGEEYTGFVGPTGLPKHWKKELGDW